MIKRFLKHLQSNSFDDRLEIIGDYLFNIGKLIGTFVLYISKAYLLMIIICAVIFGGGTILLYIAGLIEIEDSLLNTISWGVGIGTIFIPLFNIRIFLILFFYRFNKVEIILETCLFMLFIRLEIVNEKFISLWPVILLMLLYIALKKTILKFYLKRNERNLPQ